MGRILFTVSLWIVAAVALTAAAAPDAPGTAVTDTIVRKPLLTAAIEGSKNVDRVESKQIDFSPGQKTGVHLHPCPVVGYIASGSVVFQVEGESARTLKAGEAFFEPANKKILRFDALDQPTRFVAYYLLGKNDKELIRNLAP
ncbi:MAG TPA: cupin domain-containing protein [Steroidobacteraceae bacterium]|jgi:quercetin dioxygenase-like cupin family protein